MYGTLQPGESNHWVVRQIKGDWLAGTVRGYKFEISWGPADGYPGVILDAGGPEIEVTVLTADNLDPHWREIDDFEGPGYRRIKCDVTLEDGSTIEADLYEALSEIE